jgi:hypothetical protein
MSNSFSTSYSNLSRLPSRDLRSGEKASATCLPSQHAASLPHSSRAPISCAWPSPALPAPSGPTVRTLQLPEVTRAAASHGRKRFWISRAHGWMGERWDVWECAPLVKLGHLMTCSLRTTWGCRLHARWDAQASSAPPAKLWHAMPGALRMARARGQPRQRQDARGAGLATESASSSSSWCATVTWARLSPSSLYTAEAAPSASCPRRGERSKWLEEGE